MSMAFIIGCFLGPVIIALLVYCLARLAHYVNLIIILLFCVLMDCSVPRCLKCG